MKINTTNAVTNIHIPLTYVQHMSEKIKKTLTRRVPEFKIAFKPTNRVKKFFTKLKDEIPKNDLTNVIYKIKCECGLCYIGQTIQSVKKRIGQHKNDVNSIKNLNRNCNDEFLEELKGKTALTEHVALTNHKFDFDNFEIVDHTRNRSQLNILEMLHIQNNSTVNRRTDTMKLSQIYNGVLKMRNKLPRKPRPVRRNERILR
ncbi:CLUMA_CG013860, isoform A [Clunio marinus]|uniref:CLUMA_CG013860, isoform A n=1 Tax=Clunio marinus TaxID=568069 RepID=A0A1J1IK94_9DIPT|nr:CLUMA_CG013860, isoform A [Clunio marinus]